MALPSPSTTSLEVEFTHLRSTRGVLQICLTTEAGDFPDCRNGHTAIKRTISASTPRVRFTGLPLGTYAIAVIHDANSNERLDTFMGMPREGFGFSRNPAIGFGPPRFSAASFGVGSDAPAQQVRIRYLL